jgi:hypothetical protein
MRPIISTVGPLAAASANNIALSQTPGAAGPLTLNGSLVVNGVAVMDNPRRVLITTTDTTHSFTITGTSASGTTQSEVVTNSGTSVQSALDYKTVNSIVISGAASAAVTAGTSGVASTPWMRMDEWANPQISIQCDVNGTVNYTIQSTLDDPNSPTNPVAPSAVNWVNSPDANAVAATANIQTSYGGFAVGYGSLSPTFIRVTLNSGAGSVTATVIQSGVVSQ